MHSISLIVSLGGATRLPVAMPTSLSRSVSSIDSTVSQNSVCDTQASGEQEQRLAWRGVAYLKHLQLVRLALTKRRAARVLECRDLPQLCTEVT